MPLFVRPTADFAFKKIFGSPENKLDRLLFGERTQTHHRFQMMDKTSGHELANAIEVHTIELPKYNLQEADLVSASPLEQWVFLFCHASEYDSDQLRKLLPGADFSQAIQTPS